MNDTLFSQLVEASRELPGNRWSVGGNAPVMAGRMAREGCDVLLGGSFSPDFNDYLSEHITGRISTLALPLSSSACYENNIISFATFHFLLLVYSSACGE